MGISGGIQRFLIFNCLFFGLISSCISEQDRKIKKKDHQASQGELVISAAVSMQQVLQEIKLLYDQQYPQANIALNFGSSGSLQHQIEQGATVDIFISAAPQQMNNLAAKELLIPRSRQNLVKNQMVLVVPKNNQGINNFADLTHKSVGQIALGEPNSVPAGQYAREILTSLNIIDIVQQKAVYAKDARQAFNYVATGNTDAGIVYRTDALDTEQVEIIDIAPENSYSPVVYPVAILKESQNILAAQQMVQFLFTPEAQIIFQRHGFLSLENTSDH